MACLVLFCDGLLSIDQNLVLTYIGGRSRPLKVPVNLTLEELKQKIRSSLKIGRGSISLTCNYPLGSSFVATSITDDEVCALILDDASRNTLGIYVEVEQGESSYSVADTHILQPQNTIEYVQCTFSSVETSTIPPRYVIFVSLTFINF